MKSWRRRSPRIDIATEPYPNRWTHHVVVHKEEEIDEELIGWIKEAAAFAETKKRKKKVEVKRLKIRQIMPDRHFT